MWELWRVTGIEEPTLQRAIFFWSLRYLLQINTRTGDGVFGISREFCGWVVGDNHVFVAGNTHCTALDFSPGCRQDGEHVNIHRQIAHMEIAVEKTVTLS